MKVIKIWIIQGEAYPVYEIATGADPSWPFPPDAELSVAEVRDYHRARDEYLAWQHRLNRLLEESLARREQNRTDISLNGEGQ